MDSFKHVNNTMYFRYQEVSRGLLFQNILKRINDPQFDKTKWNNGTGIGPILANTFCSFKFPVSYPDNLLIGSVIHPHDRFPDRLKVTHTIWSLRHKKMAAEGDGTIVCYDFSKNEVTNIPESLNVAIVDHHQENSLDLLPSVENCVDFQSEF